MLVTHLFVMTSSLAVSSSRVLLRCLSCSSSAFACASYVPLDLAALDAAFALALAFLASADAALASSLHAVTDSYVEEQVLSIPQSDEKCN